MRALASDASDFSAAHSPADSVAGFDAGVEQAARPSRVHLLGCITEANPTASAAFLGAFSDEALTDYLRHLTLTTGPATLCRRTGTPAIVGRASRI